MKAILIAMVAFCGCNEPAPAGSPLVGKWGLDISSGGVSFHQTYELLAGGTANDIYRGTGDCSGTVTYAGGGWSATETTITFTGTATCSGGPLSCTIMGMAVEALTCGGGTAPANDAISYTLSNNNNTLTLSGGDGGTPTVLTRE